MNEDGVLDEREFTALVQSRTLDLGVSKEVCRGPCAQWCGMVAVNVMRRDDT